MNYQSRIRRHLKFRRSRSFHNGFRTCQPPQKENKYSVIPSRRRETETITIKKQQLLPNQSLIVNTTEFSNMTSITIDDHVLQSAFIRQPASRSLRVTCYGSSSSKTPEKYLKEARNLGYILAKRGHTCVNGAGSFGCMAAMNDGAVEGNGHIVGVIHKMWLVDQGDWASTPTGKTLRDGGAHSVFDKASNKEGPIREMLIADGPDLQERKRLLVEGAHALVVLPGGPGTWDELWEMACARKLGLHNSLPIVCVNVDHFYQPFVEMMQRAYEDRLLEQTPDEVIHFVETAEEAVRWLEEIQDSDDFASKAVLKKRPSTLRKSSFFGSDLASKFPFSLMPALSWISGSDSEEEGGTASVLLWQGILPLMVGLSVGVLVGTKSKLKR